MMLELADFKSDEEEAAVFFAGSICLLLVQGKMVGRNGRYNVFDSATFQFIMTRMPDFKNDAEAAAWFDTHDTAVYMDNMEETTETFDVERTPFP